MPILNYYIYKTQNKMIQKIKNIKPLVKSILENYPATRDDDNKLLLKVWAFQNPKLRDKDFYFIDFAMDLMKDKYANSESVRRSRQKLQEQNEELRGFKYKSRSMAQVQVRDNINA